jgi:hypothetical protein
VWLVRVGKEVAIILQRIMVLVEEVVLILLVAMLQVQHQVLEVQDLVSIFQLADQQFITQEEVEAVEQLMALQQDLAVQAEAVLEQQTDLQQELLVQLTQAEEEAEVIPIIQTAEQEAQA